MGSNAQYWNGTFRLIELISGVLFQNNPAYEWGVYCGVRYHESVFLFSQFDRYVGDIPYSGALGAKKREVFTPKYDTQEKVYTDPQIGNFWQFP